MNRYVLEYSLTRAGNPVLAEAILKTKVLVNILSADVKYSSGRMVVSVIGDARSQKRLVAYLLRNGVRVTRVESSVVKDEKKCVDCCACFGVCPTKAISIVSMRMTLDPKECIRCGSCVEVCPTRALKLE